MEPMNVFCCLVWNAFVWVGMAVLIRWMGLSQWWFAVSMVLTVHPVYSK
jgi:hypothetical protein